MADYYDECESDESELIVTARRIDELEGLILQACNSGESEGVIVKGTPSGSALHYRPRFCLIVSSIRVKLIKRDNGLDHLWITGSRGGKV